MPPRLTVEVHNRLNPLGSDRWAELFPRGPSPEALVDRARLQRGEEPSFLTILVRDETRCILVMPLHYDISACATVTVNARVRRYLCAPDRPILSRLVGMLPAKMRTHLFEVDLLDWDTVLKGESTDAHQVLLAEARRHATAVIRSLSLTMPVETISTAIYELSPALAPEAVPSG